MKLNYECVRDVMLYLEAQPYITLNKDGAPTFKSIALKQISDCLPNFKKEDIYYALFNLEQAGFIKASSQPGNGAIQIYLVNYITYEGHEFLERIKEPSIWEKTRTIAGKIGAASLSIISQIASDIIIKLVTTQI